MESAQDELRWAIEELTKLSIDATPEEREVARARVDVARQRLIDASQVMRNEYDRMKMRGVMSVR